jgi:hypothetical protein
MKFFIYQIFYDNNTKKKILPGFIPIDNSSSLRPDWYEFWVMLNYLRTNNLEDNSWYGFLSPKFAEKTCLNSSFIFNFLNEYHEYDAALFSPGWDQISFFLNTFEQGEIWHPGLFTEAQNFINYYNLEFNLDDLVTDSLSSVFSNFVIAKKSYWNKWKIFADYLFDFYENNHTFDCLTNYGSSKKNYPMKVFIQERLSSLVLSCKDLNIISIDNSFSAPIFEKLFPNNLYTRELLQFCNSCKVKYRESLDDKYLKLYWDTRRKVVFTPPLY